ncbi:unnamed protein product [Danaus chrysippus]|uniref:(African queen) hypothetical protein n=1 Tax=Danaus chrysippus TaxID=151541 RepID=A0A8J2W8G5_9NEOP|nr:unnamed protein product [Danaus chrysippus]
MIILIVCSMAVASSSASTATESYKDQFCTDPRTMEKYEAYTEWADAYSCSRHRCQPGGRNLAIYTVGCKRVEAPESAIECEEVVEDTNMQFPYCCTRLRCLVVVRGEVWTRVLGQPWETLPAAPWSHMYKMKKPPPADNTFAKSAGPGPIYELASEPDAGPHEKMLRSQKQGTPAPDCVEAVPRVAPSPDIVIALATNNEEKEHKKTKSTRHKRVKKLPNTFEVEADREHNEVDFEDSPLLDKNVDGSDEKSGSYVTQKNAAKSSWTDIPSNQWTEHDPSVDVEVNQPSEEKEKPALQALVDAIGNRMRDIESVVQRMSEKVHTVDEVGSGERRSEVDQPRKHHKQTENKEPKEPAKQKKPNADNDNYKRFSVKNRSKYLHPSESSTDRPLFVEDADMNGYFSDASNGLVRRAGQHKDPPPTYMAPVDNRRKTHTETSDEGDKKHKKHTHKKKKKSKSHKKHHGKEEKRKHFNRLASTEVDKNIVSLEDSAVNK